MLEAFYGSATIGAIVMPVNFRLVPADFEYMLNHSEAKVIIVEEGLTHLIETVRDRLKTVEHFIIGADKIAADKDVEAGNSEDRWQDYESLLSAASPDKVEPVTVDENDTAALLYTSGLQEIPKCDADAQKFIFERNKFDYRIRPE